MHGFVKFLVLLWFYSSRNKASVILFKDFFFVLCTIESSDWHSNHVRHFIGIDNIQSALESCKISGTCRDVRVIERKFSAGQKYLFKLRRCSSYGGSINRELIMRVS